MRHLPDLSVGRAILWDALRLINRARIVFSDSIEFAETECLPYPDAGTGNIMAYWEGF